ncbi:MAG TPA: hypothetical protein VNM48_18835, partial [Chloroflexota bacterium]|nr:hypothetical protein [Chloroflexota bacterium]
MRLLRPLRSAPFKPALPVLDWQKPLTRAFVGGGIWFLTEGGGTVLRNLVSGAVGTLTGGLGSWGQGRHGPVVGTTTTSTTTRAATLASDGTTVVPTGPCTILLAYRKRSGVLADTGAIGLPGAGGDGTARCGVHLPWSDGIVYWDYGGLVDGVTELAAAGLSFGDDLWAFTVGARGMEIWQNGRLRASNTSNPTRIAGVAPFVLGSHATTNTDNAEWSFAAIAPTQLSKDTLAQLTDLPAVQSRLVWTPLQRYWFDPVAPPQYARPSSDSTIAGWTPTPASPTTLWDKLDEAAASEADFIQSAAAPTGAAPAEVGLSSIVDPVSSIGHVLRIQAAVDAVIGGATTLTTELRQGTAALSTPASWADVLTAAPTTFEHALSAVQADAITSYGTLRDRFTPVQAAAPLPVVQAVGTAVGGIATVSPAWPVHASNDVALLFIETCGGEAAILSVPAGFVEVLNSPQATGATIAGTRITVFWCRATSTAMGAPTVADA